MAREGKSLAQLAAEFPRYHQVKKNVEVADDRKLAAMGSVSRLLETKLVQGRVRDVTLDGLKRVFEDHAWLLFRKSQKLVQGHVALFDRHARSLALDDNRAAGRSLRL